jgi:hypothetical protein
VNLGRRLSPRDPFFDPSREVELKFLFQLLFHLAPAEQ